MKEILENFNQVFENRIRLAVMSVLAVNERIEFNTLKQTLDLTDGNLASHISVLEKHGYVEVKKKFVGKKTHTSYSATKSGKKAFLDHLNALETFLKSNLA